MCIWKKCSSPTGWLIACILMAGIVFQPMNTYVKAAGSSNPHCDALFEQERYLEAIQCYDKFSKPHDVFVPNNDDAKVLYEAGNALFDQGKYKEAVESYERAMRLRGDFAPLYYNLAEAQARLEEVDKAISNFREYLRKRPNGEKAEDARRRIEELKAKQTIQVKHSPVVGIWAVDDYLQTEPVSHEKRLWKFYPDGTVVMTRWRAGELTWKLIGDRLEIRNHKGTHEWTAEVTNGAMKGNLIFSIKPHDRKGSVKFTGERKTNNLDAKIPLYEVCGTLELKCIDVETGESCDTPDPWEEHTSFDLRECREQCKKIAKKERRFCIEQ